jgi:hypothetical protein
MTGLSAPGLQTLEDELDRSPIAHIAEENDASACGGHAALDGVVGLCSPFPNARVGVAGVDPTTQPAQAPNGSRLPQTLNGLIDTSPDQGFPGATPAICSGDCSARRSSSSNR